MIERYRGDDTRNRIFNNIGRVEPTAEPDLQQQNVGAVTREQ